MNSNTTHPVIIITGAAKRIGAHCAYFFHERGYNIVLHYRSSEQEANAICDELNRSRSASCVLIQGDFTSPSFDYSEFIRSAHKRWGRLDVLFNNASSFYPTPLSEINEDNWQELMSSNLKAPLFLSKYAMPHLNEHTGCIVNLIDINTHKLPADHSIYLAAKAGLENLTYSMAKDYAPRIRVNGIAPGNILWPEQAQDDIDTSVLKHIPLERQGTPEDIARTALFLIEQADYITGNIISVDGGKRLV
ncbi:MAG: pteridine reductase [Pseudomonadota bacterium]